MSLNMEELNIVEFIVKSFKIPNVHRYDSDEKKTQKDEMFNPVESLSSIIFPLFGTLSSMGEYIGIN